MGGKGMMGERPVFDPATIVTISGTVKEVLRQPHGPGFVGLHLATLVNDELVTVHLGPAAFVEPRLTFAVGDTFEATGSRVMFKGAPVLLTTVVKKGAQTLELRGKDGAPKFRSP
jgi:hypothetical protein